MSAVQPPTLPGDAYSPVRPRRRWLSSCLFTFGVPMLLVVLLVAVVYSLYTRIDPLRQTWTIPGSISAIAFSPDGQVVALGAYLIVPNENSGMWGHSVPQIQLRQARDGQLLRTIPVQRVGSVAFTPGGKTLVSGGGTLLQAWRVSDGRLLYSFQGHTGDIHSVAVSADGKTIASGAEDRTVRLWQVQDGKPLQTLQGAPDGVQSVAWSADGQLVAGMARHGALPVWRQADGQIAYTVTSRWGLGLSVAFSSTEPRLLVGGEGWDIFNSQDGALVFPGPGSGGIAAYRPNGQVVAVTGGRGTAQIGNFGADSISIQLVRVADGHTVQALRHPNPPLSRFDVLRPPPDRLPIGDGLLLAWSPDGHLLVSVRSDTGRDASVCFWSVTN